jgi:hypothetical protein
LVPKHKRFGEERVARGTWLVRAAVAAVVAPEQPQDLYLVHGHGFAAALQILLREHLREASDFYYFYF